ncbi:MAG: peptidylprolyl isomerase [Acidobacteria bacterium]|nr:peptidylprolyl isomerase [Acidobacteriota bacterium]
MKRLVLSILLAAGLAAAQAPAASVADDPVVAVLDGKAWKRSEVERLARSLPQRVQQNFFADKKAFLKTLALMTKLSAMAEQEGLDKQDPHYYTLLYNRNLYLAQARIAAEATRRPVMPEEQQKFYDEHKQEYAEAKVKVIFLGYNDNPLQGAEKKPMTGAEAEALATEIVKQARGGTDFVALVKKHSMDEDSKAKDGDFPLMKPGDATVPEQIKAAVFSMKPGQVTDPLRQPGGFWVIKMVDFVTPAFEQVKDQIFTAIQDQRVKAWLQKMQESTVVEYKDAAYLDTKAPVTQPPAAPRVK